MTKISIFILYMFILFANCSSHEKNDSSTDYKSIFPDKLDGFSLTSPLKIYPADSLYEYINGEAEEYVTYGTVQVVSCEYSKEKLKYSIDLFEFEDPLGAFGIYSKRRLPGDRFIELGTETVLGNSFIYYLKDRYLITINFYGNSLPDFESLSHFAVIIDRQTPGYALYPQQIMVFPQKRLVSHSEKFWIHGFKNFAAPESCFSADYRKRDKICTLFYSLNRTQREFDTFVDVINIKCRILSHTAGVGKNSIYAVSETEGKILVGYSNQIIFGVLNVSGDYWAKALCKALFENIEPEPL
ncbi:MAG: hypothetical protein J7K40_14735 [candidate division Zixibacteria bacterium]|nr:hypothetical protein [candidate division Zixibacteria bacterium]